MRIVCMIWFIYVSSFKINGQPPVFKRPDGIILSTAAIDKIVKDLMDTAEVTGLCIGLINENKPVYIKSYGWKNTSTRQPNDTSTVLYAASFSKSVFAYFVMQMVDDGKIELDKPLYQYLSRPIPEFNDYKDLAGDDRWRQITARHCLSHSTGFPNWRWLNPKGNEKLEFFFDPGARYAYSGEGLQLLQLAVEAIFKKDLETLMKEKVFQSLGMRRSSYVWQLLFENNYALPYDENENELAKVKSTAPYAAGSLETTIADYTRFISALMEGRGLSEKSRTEMLSSQLQIYTRRQFPSLNTDTTSENRKIGLSYGLGWGVFQGNYGKSYFKEGHGEGWENYNINFPDSKTAIIIMTNSSNGESIFKPLVDSIIGNASIPWEWEGYTPFEGFIHLPTATLKKYTGVFEKDGIKVTISFQEDNIYVECRQKGLSRSRLYAKTETTFFIKQFPLTIEFVTESGNEVTGIRVKDEGQQYEMIRITDF